jgi:hypothetical protein
LCQRITLPSVIVCPSLGIWIAVIKTEVPLLEILWLAEPKRTGLMF